MEPNTKQPDELKKEDSEQGQESEAKQEAQEEAKPEGDGALID